MKELIETILVYFLFFIIVFFLLVIAIGPYALGMMDKQKKK